MPTVRRTKPWTGKPSTATQLNFSNPVGASLAKGLAFAFNAGSGGAFTELVNGQSFALNSAASWVQTPFGWGILGDGSGAISTKVAVTTTIAAPFSITLAYQNPSSSALGAACEWGASGLSGYYTNGTKFGIVDGGGSYVCSWTTASHALSSWVVVTVTIDGLPTSSNAVGYLNGVNLGSVSTGGNGNLSAPVQFGLSGAGVGWASTVAAIFFHPYVLSPTEASAIGSSPAALWQVFRPAQGAWKRPAAAVAATSNPASLLSAI